MLKALGFNCLKVKSLSKLWFQTANLHPYTAEVVEQQPTELKVGGGGGASLTLALNHHPVSKFDCEKDITVVLT